MIKYHDSIILFCQVQSLTLSLTGKYKQLVILGASSIDEKLNDTGLIALSYAV